MGLKVGEVRLEPYNPLWKEQFKTEAVELNKIMGDIALKIKHIGSTSIENLLSKPIIDILVGVKELDDFEKVRNKFLNNSDYSIKEDSKEDEILIRKGLEENRTHYIHVVEIESDKYKDLILFRDYLISNPKTLKEYENLKIELAGKYPSDRIMYTDSKDEFINKVLILAKENKRNNV